MKRTAPDRTAYQPKPVERIELDEGNVKRRIIIVAAAILVAVAAFIYVIANSTSVDDGWRTIEPNTASDAAMNCAQDFEFNYYLGGSGISATAENKAIVALYTQATEKAYRLFNSSEYFPEDNNIFVLNRDVGKPVQVDPALYQAFELIESLNSRYVYLAPVYEEYHTLFFCNDDWETVSFDPYQSEDVSEYFAQVAAFARNPEDVQVHLMGDNTLMLTVSDAYAAFAEEWGITKFVDLYWMKDAFIIDYLAQTMEDAGYNRGAISSYDGFVRCLSEDQLSYSFHLYDRFQKTLVRQAARLDYPGGTSLVHLHDFRLNTEKELYYYQFEDGSVRTAYADLADGKSKSAVPALIATSREAGCAETLLRLLPHYATDTLDQSALAQLPTQGVYPLYCVGNAIVTSSVDVTLAEIVEGYTVQTMNLN